MIKELFATLMLSASLGMPNVSTYKNDSVSSFQYHDFYCFRRSDDWDFSPYFDYSSKHFELADICVYLPVDALSYQYLYGVTLEVFYDDEDGACIFHFYDDVDDIRTFTLISDMPTSDVPLGLYNSALFIQDYRVLASEEQELFNYFYTRNINENFVFYNGWYTPSKTYNTSADSVYNFCGNFLVDNNYFNSIFRDTTTMSAVFVIDDDYYTNPYYMYKSTDGWLMNQNSFYIQNCAIPVVMYNRMITNGAFVYSSNMDDSDISDLFYGIADTPIRVLWGMFDFELFGMNFGNVFFSVLTLLLLLFVIRLFI